MKWMEIIEIQVATVEISEFLKQFFKEMDAIHETSGLEETIFLEQIKITKSQIIILNWETEKPCSQRSDLAHFLLLELKKLSPVHHSIWIRKSYCSDTA